MTTRDQVLSAHLFLTDDFTRNHLKYLIARLEKINIMTEANGESHDFGIVGISGSGQAIETTLENAENSNLPLLILAGFLSDELNILVDKTASTPIELSVQSTTYTDSLKLNHQLLVLSNTEQDYFKVDADMRIDCPSRLSLASSVTKKPYPVIVDVSSSQRPPMLFCTSRIETLHADTDSGDQLNLLKLLVDYITGNRKKPGDSNPLQRFTIEEYILNSPVLYSMLIAGKNEMAISNLMKILETVGSKLGWLRLRNAKIDDVLSRTDGIEYGDDRVAITSRHLLEQMEFMQKDMPLWVRQLIDGDNCG